METYPDPAEAFPDRAPDMEVTDAEAMVRELFGLEPRDIKDLGSYQDRNFRVRTASGTYVLKVANGSEPRDALDAQNAAMLALEPLTIETPVPVPTRSGSLLEFVDLNGSRHAVRLLTYVDGSPMHGFGHFDARTAFRFGAVSGTLTRALADFDHRGAVRVSQWDVRRAPAVVEQLGAALPEHLGARVRRLSNRAEHALQRLMPDLPLQTIHGDVTDFNVVATVGADRRPEPSGVIDFGDLAVSWRVCDAAVTLTSLLVKDVHSPISVASAALAGYVSEQPLTATELEALWPLMAARACAGLASTAHQLKSEPDNPYLHQNYEVDKAVFEAVEAIPFAVGHAALSRAAGVEPRGSAPLIEALLPATHATGGSAAPLLAGTDLRELPRVDLGVESDVMNRGAWSDPRSIRQHLEASVPSVIAFGEAHAHMATANSLTEPSTIHIGLTVLAPVGAVVLAPTGGTVESTDHSVRLITGHALDVIVNGVTPELPTGTTVDAGDAVAVVAPSTVAPMPAHVRVQVVPAGEPAPPSHVRPSEAQAWMAAYPDPSRLLGLEAVELPESPESLLQRRDSALAGVQKHYYVDPPRIERGWRHHLIDTDGRVYLDGVNNVSVLGHSHPAVEESVGRALRTLNTNSRFHYRAAVDFAEMLKSTLPPSLSQVFLVATGSEAVDLALRLARVHSGAKDTICLQTAYHGWTTASDEVSSALMDNPNALGTRPEHIHLATPPNLYRGAHTGTDAGTRYADDVRRLISEIDAQGRRLGAFICETLNGNAGGIELPAGYLAEVYRDVRAAGGVVIADEVQVGYGRLGSHFWGFDMNGVVPDIVCLAKATGNGFPVAAVVCTPEIAESFSSEGSFFASMGGSPAGAAAASAVLRTIEEEDLMGNAARMGARLRAGLERLVEKHPLAGAVHGLGLYLGLELVLDPITKEPATEATDALCERLLRLGVIMAPTGDYMNVLKIKPPLCIDEAGVDFLLAALDEALTSGW